MQRSIASITISDLTKPTAWGERVNRNVQIAAAEPRPDYEAMRRVVSTPEAVVISDDESAIRDTK